MQEKIGIIGAGRLGKSLARALCEVGYAVCAIHDVNRAAAESCISMCGTQIKFYKVEDFPDFLTLVFISVPDDFIASVAGELALSSITSQTIVVHTSGARGIDALAPLHRKTSLLASIHPIQTFSGSENDWKRLFGITFGLEGQNPVLLRLRAVVDELRGRTITVSTGHKPLYHLGCVFASNFIVTLFAAASRVMAHVGFDEREAIKILYPLAEASMANVKMKGAPASATGPITRGDIGTVVSHLQELSEICPQVLPLYRALGQYMTDLVFDLPGVDKEKIIQIKEMLNRTPLEPHGQRE